MFRHRIPPSPLHVSLNAGSETLHLLSTTNPPHYSIRHPPLFSPPLFSLSPLVHLLPHPRLVPYLSRSSTPPSVIPKCPIIQSFSCTRATNTESGFTQPSLAHNWSAGGPGFSQTQPYLLDQALTELSSRSTSTTIRTFLTTLYTSLPPLLLPALLSLKVMLDNASFDMGYAPPSRSQRGFLVHRQRLLFVL